MTVHWGEKRYYSLDYYLKKTYGEKLYKISLDGGIHVQTGMVPSEPTVAFSAAVEVPAILPPVVLCLSQSRLKPGSSSLQKNIPDHLTLLIFRHIPTLMLL